MLVDSNDTRHNLRLARFWHTKQVKTDVYQSFWLANKTELTEDSKLNIKIILAVAPLMLATGCASIVNGTNQPVSVETKHQGDAVAGANCKLANNKGTWFVKTPGSVTVHRSAEDLSVTCEKDGLDPGMASVPSSTKPMAFGNILFGGPIGAGIDVANGSAFDYPGLIQVEMEQGTAATEEAKPAAKDVPEAANAEQATEAEITSMNSYQAETK